MPVEQCAENHCSHLIVQELTQIHTMEIPLIETVQNGLQFYSTSMSIDQIVLYSDIPAMDGSHSTLEEAEYTWESINTVAAGGVPPRWQRPTKVSRMAGARGIPTWLNGAQDRTMPDGILLGVREEGLDPRFFSVDMNNVIVVGGRNIRTATISNHLLASCPIHGVFTDAVGNQIFQNRCDVHGCEHHEVTTSPLSIIDGQHRTIGLHLSTIAEKQVTVSLLPIVPTTANKGGYPIKRQAKIFEQVNSEGHELKANHLLWLKRMFGDWSIPPAPVLTTGPNGRIAYDLLAYLGSTGLPAPALSPWVGQVKFVEASNQHLVNSLFVTKPASGQIMGSAAMESNISALGTATAITGQSAQEIINCWLEGWQTAIPSTFTLGTGLFYNPRAFAALIRTMSVSINEMVAAGNVPFNTANFGTHMAPFATDLANPNWNRFATEGTEEPQKNMYNLLKFMLKNAGLSGPTHTTYMTPVGTAPTWAEWVNLPPDPISNLSVPTCLLGGSQPPSPDLRAGNPRALIGTATTIEWDAPINIGKKPTAMWRRTGLNYQRINLFGNRIMPQDVCHDNRRNSFVPSTIGGAVWNHIQGASGDWDLMVEYTTSAGKTSTIEFGFTS